MKKIFIVVLLFLISILFPRQVGADFIVVGESSSMVTSSNNHSGLDYRVITLEKYLESHNSPLSKHANDFVIIADKYNLDWRLVPAISGVESTFGKRIPYGSYNAYGWVNGNYYFESWEDSIEIVSKTLSEKYIARGAISIDQIGKIYAPPSPTWSWKVQYFMDQIEPFPFSFSLES